MPALIVWLWLVGVASALTDTCNAVPQKYPVYHHGFNEPVDLPCVSSEEAEKWAQKIISLKSHWVPRYPNHEDNVQTLTEHFKQLRAIGDDLYFYTLGGFHLYMSHEDVLAIENNYGELLQDSFGKLYEKVLGVLEQQLGEPVRVLKGQHFAFRVMDSDVIKTDEQRAFVAKFHSPPHYDTPYGSVPFPEDIMYNHTIAFTLPLKLPKQGSGLKIYEAYHDHYNNIWNDFELNAIPPLSTDQALALPSHMHPYTAGVLALHSGMELHTIPTFPVEKGDHDFRITLQGWGIWYNGEWILYS